MCNLKIMRYPGRLIYRYNGEMVYYLNQLDWFDGIPYPDNPDDLTWEDNEWIAANFIDRYLTKHYGIGSKEYYNLIHGFEINYHRTCIAPHCNNKVAFRSLWHGYRQTCSYECRDMLQSERLTEWYATATDDERRAFIDAQHQWWWDDSYKSNYHDMIGFERETYTSTKVVATWNFKKFLSNGNLDDLCEFYIAKTIDKFKFGVSITLAESGWYKHYIKSKVILRLPRIQAGLLEYLIKLDMDIDTEYIDWNLVEKFRRSYSNNLKLITSQKFNDYRKLIEDSIKK